jgi:hypothetical protein
MDRVDPGLARVVNIHHGASYDVYIGRPGRGSPGPWGNPIIPGRPCSECGIIHGRDPELLACYRRWLYARCLEDRAFVRALADLHGHVLGCFCLRKDGSGLCHGHILAHAAQWAWRKRGATQAIEITSED